MGAYRIPLETGLLIPSDKSDNRKLTLYFGHTDSRLALTGRASFSRRAEAFADCAEERGHLLDWGGVIAEAG